MAKRPQQRVERRYVVEWVEKNYPRPLAKLYNVRLGEVPPEIRDRYPGQPASSFKVYLSYADAVVVTEDELLVIEAKIYEPEKGIGQLNRYARLVPTSPDLRMWASRPVKKLLVTWRSTFPIVDEANHNGVSIVIFRPAWIEPILRSRNLL